LLAALYCTQTTPRDAPLHMVTRSRDLIKTVTEAVPAWENRGWLDAPHANTIRALIGHVRARSAPTTIQQAEKRQEIRELNDAQDDAKVDVEEHRDKPAKITIPRNFDLTGMRLRTMTQALAYKGIMKMTKPDDRPSTTRRLDEIRRQALARGDEPPRALEVWRGLRHKDIRKPISDFLWKLAHNAYKCGSYWSHIPGYESRQTCTSCNTEDSTTHLLFQCEAPGQNLVWTMAEKLWTRKHGSWQKPGINDLGEVGVRQWKDENKKRNLGKDRLWRIILSESAYLIWLLRCERVIRHEDDDAWRHPNDEIRRRWAFALNNRLQLDREMTRLKYGSKMLRADRVTETWKHVLDNEQAIGKNWV
ncbi:hypothetical protein FOMPIDRAFT_1082578, partial [Fomitopsis schrenkii]